MLSDLPHVHSYGHDDTFVLILKYGQPNFVCCAEPV